jgi:NAD(P)-dependent dehydrogenase (short-subunit alcohol dehydrogenase family)
MDAKALSGKTYVVTGANTGIGRATAEALARQGAKVVLACRSEAKTRPVLDAIAAAGGDAELVQVDLADLDSVRRAADGLLTRALAIDGLVNNAGLAGLRGVTRQGFEVAFGTNHLGHFLWTTMLLPRVEAARGRIVNVASKAHYDAPRRVPGGIDWKALERKTKTVTGLREYAVSKLCNVLFTKELARGKAGAGVHSYALHPGVVASDAWRHAPQPFRWMLTRGLLSNEEGAKTSLYCATSPDVAGDDGLYYDACQPKRPSALAEDARLAKELWERSVAWTKAP